MTIYRETMTAYRKRPALSAGFLWDIVSECPAYAWAHADMNPERLERSRADHLEFGEIAHLAVLENEPLAERISVIDAKDWRTQMARDLRDQAYIDDKIPVLYKDLLRVQAVRKALEASHAAPLLFGDGESELTYTWYEPDRPGETFLRQECKARIDRYTGSTLVHLKTAASPAPDSFAKACANFGYDLAAAWYLDGWIEQTMDHKWDDYCFVVVGSKPPHLVGVYQLSGDDLEEGRALYQMALQECRRAVETGVWRGYGYNDGSPMIINMPAWRQRQAFEEEGVRRG